MRSEPRSWRGFRSPEGLDTSGYLQRVTDLIHTAQHIIRKLLLCSNKSNNMVPMSTDDYR